MELQHQNALRRNTVYNTYVHDQRFSEDISNFLPKIFRLNSEQCNRKMQKVEGRVQGNGLQGMTQVKDPASEMSMGLEGPFPALQYQGFMFSSLLSLFPDIFFSSSGFFSCLTSVSPHL